MENKLEIKRLGEFFKKQTVSQFKMTSNMFCKYTIYAGDSYNSQRLIIKKGLKKSLAIIVLKKLNDGTFNPKILNNFLNS